MTKPLQTSAKESGVLMPSLSWRMIDHLKAMRSKHGLSDSQFRIALDAPFGVGTLKRALRGSRVSEATYAFLAGSIRRHAAAPEELDNKTLSAGERAAEDYGSIGRLGGGRRATWQKNHR